MTTPTHIGPYQIIRELGRGGMGVVYLAQDPAVNRQLALKLLPADLATDEGSRRRFEQEVAVFARLEHPHIVPTYAVDLGGPSPVLVMRYLAGGTLRDRTRGGRLAPAELWRAMGQIARALDYAHNEGLVHRDVKPTNILFDDTGNAYVSDFGIAKVINATSMLTMANSMTGSPAYMSPEQFRQDTVDGRSDQYSLAVVLYEALTGRPPFSGDTLQLMYQHVYERPPNIHSLAEGLPAELSAVIERALSKRAAQRYPSIETFIAEAQRQATAPAPAPPRPAPMPEPETPAERGRPPIVSGAGGGRERTEDDPPRRRPKPAIVSGAGGTTAAAGGRRKLLVVLGVVGTLAVLFFLFTRLGGPSAAGGPPATPAATPASTPTATAEPTAAAEASAPPGEQPVVIIEGVETPADWRLPPGGGPVLVRSREQAMQLHFVGGEALYLAPEAIVLLALIDEDGREVLQVEVRNGRLVAETGGRPFLITNPFGAAARLQAGLMGIDGSLEPLRFAVDCLTGDGCALTGDLDDTALALAAGEAGQVGSNGRPAAAGPARFETFAPLSERVPTATATPVPTDTPTATATPVPTAMPTRAPEPAITDTPVAATTTPPKPPQNTQPPPEPTRAAPPTSSPTIPPPPEPPEH